MPTTSKKPSMDRLQLRQSVEYEQAGYLVAAGCIVTVGLLVLVGMLLLWCLETLFPESGVTAVWFSSQHFAAIGLLVLLRFIFNR